MKAKDVSAGGIFTGICTAALYFASIVPTTSVALTALAGLMPALALFHCGAAVGFMVYLASAIIAALIAPVKSYVIIFAAVFGLYPLIKCFADKIGSKFIRIPLKLIIANIQIGFLIFVYSKLLFGSAVLQKILEYGIPYMFIFLNIVFFVYEAGITQFFDMYKHRILNTSRHGGTL